MLGLPCAAGPAWSPKTAFAITRASQNHEMQIRASIGSWLNFQLLWAAALNEAAKGNLDAFCMLHSDVELEGGFVDVLYDVMQEHKADLVSAIIPQKETSGITSSGIGDEADHWVPHRRFTMREIHDAAWPETFDNSAFPGYYLLHNNGLWIADLHQEKFRQTEDRGGRTFIMAHFEFPNAIEEIEVNGEKQFVARGESEDWHFSRTIHKLGIRSFITRKLALDHMGTAAYPNTCAWGTAEHDEATKAKWGNAAEAKAAG